MEIALLILCLSCLSLCVLSTVLWVKYIHLKDVEPIKVQNLQDDLAEKNQKIQSLEEKNSLLSSYQGKFEEASNTIQYLRAENKEEEQKREVLREQLAKLDKERELFRQQQESLQKERDEWSKEKEAILHKLTAELIEKNSQSQNEFGKNQQEEIKKTTEKLYENFEDVLKKVSSLNDDMKKSDEFVSLTKNALLSPGGAGQTSEITLENILKASGLKEKDSKGFGDYMLQSHFAGLDSVGKRPDAVIWLPNNHIMIIDSKSSSHFLELQQAIDSKDIELEKQLMNKIKERMRQHLEDLKKRDYAKSKLEELSLKNNDKNATITTIMFLQTEKMLEIVKRADEKLVFKALEAGIQITSISGLINLLDDAKLRINHFKQQENIEEIKKIIKKIIDSIHRIAQKSQAMGKSIRTIANKYDEFVGTFNNTLVQARKVNELGIESDKKNLDIRLDKIAIEDSSKIIDQTPYGLELDGNDEQSEEG